MVKLGWWFMAWEADWDHPRVCGGHR